MRNPQRNSYSLLKPKALTLSAMSAPYWLQRRPRRSRVLQSRSLWRCKAAACIPCLTSMRSARRSAPTQQMGLCGGVACGVRGGGAEERPYE